MATACGKGVIGDNTVDEAAPMSFPLKAGSEEIRRAPLAYCPELDETKATEKCGEVCT